MAEIEGLQNVLNRLGEMAFDTRRVEKPLHAIGVHMIGSVQKNFQAQGRPKKWTPLSPRTIAGRRKGRGKGGPKILIDMARLKNSISERVILSSSPAVEVGTNVIYAPRQHFGYDGGGKTGRGHSTTPAREFLLIQEEDNVKIQEIVVRHIARK